MNILETLVQLRDDLKTWVTNNLNELNNKIDEKTIPIDSELNATSANPVQNKVINAEISSLSNLVGDKSVATQISTAIANQDLFSGDYNDLENAPNILDDNSDNMVITDEAGNIIFKVDAEGTHTTDVKINGTSLGAKISEWDAKSGFSGDYNDLTNAPNISEDNSDNIIIADNDGNIIFKVDAAGAHTTTLDTQNITINNENIDNIMDKKISDAVKDFESFSGDYNDLKNAPNIAEDGSGNMIIADEQGNVIFKADAAGIHSTTLTLNGEDINNKINNHADNTAIHVTSTDKANWNNKVDKVDGKGLSSNDFTNEDKAKLDSLPDDISDINIAVDDTLSTTSENPVQNKVVTEAINNLNYNDLDGTPNIIDDESKELFVADGSGNVIARINETGIHSIGISINGTDVAGLIDSKIDAEFNDSTETWVFTLEDGSSVNKTVVVR